ncbi:MAG: glycosyltransferase family 2 protein [Pseudomonadota bacterium]|nr:glycosyltransferase family 2 protein [Pseudomonadota bacterium]
MNANTGPLVSIIIPSFNQGRFIAETIQSCLDQDYRPIEVLVFDGASSDQTVSVLESFDAAELQWWSEPDRGVVDAVNKGLTRAKGAIISIQSSDDVFLPGAISTMVAAVQASPSLGLVYGDVELIDADSRLIGEDVQGDFDLCDYLGRLHYIPQPGTCFTRAAYEAIGSWRDNVSYVADADFWMRISIRFDVQHVPRLVARYRYHDEQRDTQRARIARDWINAVDDLMVHGGLSSRQKRFARMGKALARHRYAATEDWLGRTRALYAAVLANPFGVTNPRFPKRELFPGRDPIWRQLSRIKRLLGFAPRSG